MGVLGVPAKIRTGNLPNMSELLPYDCDIKTGLHLYQVNVEANEYKANYNVAYFSKARTGKPAERAVARERPCKHASC
jgi:hypothetical protein